ncbi:MAG TPA: DNA translocase FtsK 4TM domain-containing protein [Vicinamibacteria bacterium]|nr:DNA translocase FtsK 4TM domain-containing protein [Vicinamibacteria bacterium]
MATPVETRPSHGAELLGLVAFALALMLLIALATFDPRDPAPFFKAGVEGPARNFIGPFGAFLAEMLVPQLFGLAALLLPLVLGLLGWKLFWCKPVEAPYTKTFGNVVLLLSLAGLLSLAVGTVSFEGETVRAGGAVGELVSGLLVRDFSRTGAYIVSATALFAALVLSTQFSFSKALQGTGGRAGERLRALRTAWAHYRESRRKERLRRDVIRKHTAAREESGGLPRIRKVRAGVPEGEEPELLPEAMDGPVDLPLHAAVPRVATPAQKALPFVAPAEDEEEEARPKAAARRRRSARDEAGGEARGNWTLPPITILDEARGSAPIDNDRLLDKGRILQAKCSEFGVLGTVKEIHPGPVVTTYEFRPDAGVKYSKIVGLADDLALALEAESIRIDRVSGKGNVGIEIPNEARETIYLREILESETFRRSSGRLALGLGKAVNGEVWTTDLAAMPHLLIAGSTGTGKSVGLNCMIASILFRLTPDEVRLILIDPKRLELGVYESIPHLLTPVVTDPKIASNVLKWAVAEMERRIRMLASEGVRNIEQFNNIIRAERGSRDEEDGEELKPLHYIVIVIDELADLMMISAHEVEESITRLAQMARAVGIHLILATQRPSVDVITGLIKANFPSRISFRVAARVDSRTILDSIGAEQLLGRGDMLFLPPGSARLIRVHGAYVTEHEIARLTSFLRKQGEPAYDDSVGKPEKAAEAAEVTDRDDLFDDAVRFVVQSGQASTSMLQRRFRVGFSRAGRLIDIMERDGIIGPADGSKPREILVAKDYYETVDTWPR